MNEKPTHPIDPPDPLPHPDHELPEPEATPRPDHELPRPELPDDARPKRRVDR